MDLKICFDSIQESFTRREDGLKAIAQLRSAIFQLYLAHGAWNFDGPSELERKMPLDRQSHSESIMIILRLVLSNMHQYLSLPCITRAVSIYLLCLTFTDGVDTIINLIFLSL